MCINSTGLINTPTVCIVGIMACSGDPTTVPCGRTQRPKERLYLKRHQYQMESQLMCIRRYAPYRNHSHYACAGMPPVGSDQTQVQAWHASSKEHAPRRQIRTPNIRLRRSVETDRHDHESWFGPFQTLNYKTDFVSIEPSKKAKTCLH
jgi:hypothetical protein